MTVGSIIKQIVNSKKKDVLKHNIKTNMFENKQKVVQFKNLLNLIKYEYFLCMYSAYHKKYIF